MKHIRTIGKTPQYAEGLCDNIVSVTQARYCFVLSFLTDFIVPLVGPLILWKTGIDNNPESQGEF
ncbi:MAG: hypothetical protein GX117_09990 [Candidatus Hydrogenedentes bacterium]|jgi:hypothetical protein|nr:hypothetical protein [Candidatus Hydrogenedentota bacterium]